VSGRSCGERGRAVPVGYWLTEHSDDRMVTTSGHIRGAAKVLTRLALARAEVVLVLNDDRRLPFRLTRHDVGN